MLVAGLGFKIAVVPFHQWAPDVYEGAPTGITAFISTGSKAAAFAAMLRIFAAGFLGGDLPGIWVPLLVVLAAASMIFGNVAALLQDNVKRMLAYSSIGHAGYILMGLVAAGGGAQVLKGGAPDPGLGAFGVSAVLIYLLVYTFTNIGAFAVVAALRSENHSGERVADFTGLSRRNPLLAFAMLVFLLSLAGIPATAGFIGKWYLFGAALSADYAWLAVIAVIMTTVSAYYYLRVVVAMYMGGAGQAPPIVLPPALAATLVVALIFTLVIGVYPARVLGLAAQGAADLQALGPIPWRL
jgi:NADH-quinone oxidoreductase subunit N